MSSTFCVNVFNGLRACNDGSAMLCCMSKEKLDIEGGTIASVKKDAFESILNGPKSTEIRNAIKNNIKHPNCQRCWDEEAGGIISKRQRDNNNHSYITPEDTSLRIVELNLGTTCNLKCRTCGPWASSSWNKEYETLKLWGGSSESYKLWLKDLNHSYDDDSAFWEEIRKHLPTIKEISMYGGEPFMVKKQWDLMKYSVESGYSTDQKILLNTNGTHYNEEYIDIMSQFKKAHIGVSIDGLEKHFEYQRHPAKWEDVLNNLLSFKKLQGDNWELSVCVTLNNQNVFYLDKTFKFFQDLNIHAHLNILHSPEWFSVTNLPLDIKQEISERFTNNTELSEVNKQWVLKAVEYMNSRPPDTNQWNRFVIGMELLDRLRDETFSSTFPEFYERIKPSTNN